ncbi:hypothetical protein [Pedobacter gandavensis]|uniref:hypothetical protein n=1 Tax=Pedobacter gandavensis TaxID=2679963 RepID=UPI00292F930B|nr:hypothetical protein [Pedobacter gandavensis]
MKNLTTPKLNLQKVLIAKLTNDQNVNAANFKNEKAINVLGNPHTNAPDEHVGKNRTSLNESYFCMH